MNTFSKFSSFVLLLSLVVCYPFNVKAQDGWELKKSGNGISVYQKDSDSKFNIVKVHAVLTGNKAKLVRILQAVERNTEWVYATNRTPHCRIDRTTAPGFGLPAWVTFVLGMI